MRAIQATLTVLVLAGVNIAFVLYMFPDTVLGRLAGSITGYSEKQERASDMASNLIFSCKQPLPEFSLGPNSNPSDDELDSLCLCVWNELPDPAKDFARKLSDGSLSSPSEAAIQAFSTNFGVAMRRCDAMNL